MTKANELKVTASTGVSDSMALLAAQIARDIFACGDDPRLGKVQRLQFMGGQYPNAETPMGGLSEYSLRCLIARTLAANAALTGERTEEK